METTRKKTRNREKDRMGIEGKTGKHLSVSHVRERILVERLKGGNRGGLKQGDR